MENLTIHLLKNKIRKEKLSMTIFCSGCSGYCPQCGSKMYHVDNEEFTICSHCHRSFINPYSVKRRTKDLNIVGKCSHCREYVYEYIKIPEYCQFCGCRFNISYGGKPNIILTPKYLNKNNLHTKIRISFKGPNQIPDLMIVKEEYNSDGEIVWAEVIYEEDKMTSELFMDGNPRISITNQIFPMN